MEHLSNLQLVLDFTAGIFAAKALEYLAIKIYTKIDHIIKSPLDVK